MVDTASSSSSGRDRIRSPSPEEDEDMANCLIMLAHSKEEKIDIHPKMKKLKIRSVTEMAATTRGYECKTCNRAFPSFQALGGHRASHKKPKLTDERKPEYYKEDLPQLLVVYEESKNIASKPLEFIETGYKNSKAKVHECSICGSEFLSGQALGGHMRRHRTAPPSISCPKVTTSVIEKPPVLSLDLNLPPPEVVFNAASLVDCHY